MFIGKLNRENAGVSAEIRVLREGYEKAVNVTGKNPFDGDKLTVDWKESYDVPILIVFSLSKEVFLSDMTVRFSGEYRPTAVELLSSDCKRVLARFDGETGKPIAASEITLSVRENLSSGTLRFVAPFCGLAIDGIDLYGALYEKREPIVFPTPKKQKFGKVIPFEGFSVDADIPKEFLSAYRILAEKWQETTKVSLLCKENGIIRFLLDTSVQQNGYRLSIKENAVVIAASDLRGAVMGAERLIHCIVENGVYTCEISDEPFCSFRGVHIFLPGENDIDFAKRFIKYVVSPMGYNEVIIEFAGGMRFDSHPEITAAVLDCKEKVKAGIYPTFPHAGCGGDGVTEKETVRDFCAYIREFGIDIISEVQSLGHVQFLTVAHPELAERTEAPKLGSEDERFADVPPDLLYPHCYCPSKEESYQITFDLLEEILDVVKPKKYVHMGHDEVYQIGICPTCSKKNPAELYANDVIRYHDYLAKRGLTMMIWSDMISPSSGYQTKSAIDLIPKDVFLLDFIWYFHMNDDIEIPLAEKGFTVGIGNLYSSHFPRYESRIRRQGITGGEISGWIRLCESDYGREGKIYDTLFTAQMLWAEEYSARLRGVYSSLLLSMIPDIRRKLSGRKYIFGMKNTETVFAGTPENNAFSPISKACDTLVFVHTCPTLRTKMPWVKGEKIGEYTVTYENGADARIPLFYGENIGYMHRRSTDPLPNAFYRHTGYTATYFADPIEEKTASGEVETFFRFEVENPHPNVKIRSITYQPSLDEVPVLIREIRGTKE